MITLSETGQLLGALEAERSALYIQSRRLTHRQQQIMLDAFTAVAQLGRQQEQIIAKMSALDETAAKLWAESSVYTKT